MKFLIYIPQLIFGGAEKVLVSVANDLVRRGHQVEVLELYEKGLLRPQFDSRVTFDAICSKAYTEKYYASLQQVKEKPWLVGKLAFSKVVGYRRYAEKLAAKRYAGRHFDVAINYLEIESPVFLLEHVQADRYLQWYHTDVANTEDPQNSDAMLPLWERMDAVICVSKVSKEHFVERYPSLAGKTHLIYNFFDSDAILQKGEEPFDYPGQRPILLSVGRLTEPKQYGRFLDVLSQLRGQGYAFSWHVLGEGGQRDALEEKRRALGLEDCVFFHGLTDNPYKYMKNCDLFVLPSGWEGFPTVTVEAKVLGCPVLATDVAGVREQMTHGETGWIVENDAQAICEGLRRLLDDPTLREKLRSSAGMSVVCSNEEKYQQLMTLCE